LKRLIGNIAGNLQDTPLVEVLGWIYTQSLEGQLLVNVRKAEYKIFFFKGVPIFANSSLSSDNIFEMLVSMGQLERDDVPRLEKMVQEGSTPEKALGQMGVVDSTQLYEMQRLLVRELIIRACGHREGTYHFEEGDSSSLEGLPMFDISPLAVIYEAINRYLLQLLPQKIQQMASKKVHLNPMVSSLESVPEIFYKRTYLLDDFNQERSVEEAISLLLKEFNDLNQALTFFYVMYSTGVLLLERDKPEVEKPPAPEPEKPGPKKAEEPPRPKEDYKVDYIFVAPKKRPKKKANRDRIAEPKKKIELQEIPAPPAAKKKIVETPAEPPKKETQLEPQAQPAATSAPAQEEPDFAPKLDLPRKLDLLETKARSSPDHFQLLSLKPDSPVQEIEQGYHNLVRQFSLEEMIKGSDPELSRRAKELKKKIQNAVHTLSSPEKRDEFEKSIYKDELARAYTLPLKRELARKQFERGKWYLNNHRPDLALERFEQAVELDPEKADYFAYVGWALYRASKGSMTQIEGYLNQALRLSARCDTACYFLGLIAKHEGREDQARDYLQRALAISPSNRSASRELDSIIKHEKEAGIFQRLFSRKK